MSKLSVSLLLGVVFISTITLSPREADARRGFGIVNRGVDYFEAGPLPEEIQGPEGAVAAFECEILGFFWAYFTINNCRPVVLMGDSISDDKQAVAAISAKYTEDDMKVGLWNKHGRLLFIALIALGAYVGVKEFFLGEDDDEEESNTDD